MAKPLEQVLFAADDPLGSAMGLQVLGFGCKKTATKRTFTEMAPWSLPFWSLNFVARGGGFVESDAAGRQRVRRGDILLRFPQEPCRYGHLAGGTWDEYWILFDGELPRRLVGEGLFQNKHPILTAEPSLITRFEAARRESRLSRPRSRVFTKLLIDLLFTTISTRLSRPFETLQPETPVRRLYDLLHANVGKRLDGLPGLSAGLGNYHSLRRTFRRHYGQAPHQAFLTAKLQTARRLLLTSTVPLAEVASRIGFEDVSYFIRLFRNRFGVSPARFRRQLMEPN